MLDKRVAITVQQADWAAPAVYAPKKDGILRFLVHNRRFNRETVRDAYPIPRMDERKYSFGESKVFSTLETISGY